MVSWSKSSVLTVNFIIKRHVTLGSCNWGSEVLASVRGSVSFPLWSYFPIYMDRGRVGVDQSLEGTKYRSALTLKGKIFLPVLVSSGKMVAVF